MADNEETNTTEEEQKETKPETTDHSPEAAHTGTSDGDGESS